MSTSWTTSEADLLCSLRSNDSWDGFTRCLNAIPPAAEPVFDDWTARIEPPPDALAKVLALEHRCLRAVRMDLPRKRWAKGKEIFARKEVQTAFDGLRQEFAEELGRLEAAVNDPHTPRPPPVMRVGNLGILVLHVGTEIHMRRFRKVLVDSVDDQIDVVRKRALELMKKRKWSAEIDGAPIVYERFRPSLSDHLRAHWEAWAVDMNRTWNTLAALAAARAILPEGKPPCTN